MRISHKSYQNYIDKLNEKYRDEVLFSPLLLNEETLVFPFRDLKNESLVISLNGKTPLMYVINEDHFFSSLENNALHKFRKILGLSKIKNISLSENDYIVNLSFELIEEEFENEAHLMLELIPLNTNAYITKNDVVVESFYKSKIRGLNKGDKYTFPSQEKLSDLCEEFTSELISKHYKNELEIRHKEKYRDFTKYLNSKIKLVGKKKDAILEDVKKAETNLKYKEIADAIFTLNLNLKSHQKELDVYGEKVSLDDKKTIIENIEHFYKKSKKAKETISRSEDNLKLADKELEAYKSLQDRFLNAKSEKECDKIISESGMIRKKKEVKETIFNRPYKVNLNGTIIYFGRNASQNDYLSFVMKLNREFTWLHIKDKSGAHLVICNTKPTENELVTACEIALLCSRATSGEIVYTLKKNVRRGHTLGEAILKNHSTIKLNSIREETKALFTKAERVN